MSSKSRKDLEKWLKTIEIKEPCNVLDIGGSQLPVRNRLLFFDNKGEYKILDLQQPHENNHNADLICDIQESFADCGCTIRTKDQAWFLLDSGWVDYFDVAFCIEVAEYWYDPKSAFRNIWHFLKRGGILYISFHTLYGLHNPKGEDCLRYTKNAIFKLAKETGFEIEEIVTKKLTDEGRTHYLKFCLSEGMRLDYKYDQTYDEGYLVKMRKI